MGPIIEDAKLTSVVPWHEEWQIDVYSWVSLRLNLENAPEMAEMRQISIQTPRPDEYDYSWVTGQIIAKIVCSDGLLLWIYVKEAP